MMDDQIQSQEASLTDEQLKAIIDAGLLMKYADRMTPEEKKRSISMIEVPGAQIGPPGLTPSLKAPKIPSLPSPRVPNGVGKWIGGGVGAKLGHPFAGWQVGKQIEQMVRGIKPGRPPVPPVTRVGPPFADRASTVDDVFENVSKGVQNDFRGRVSIQGGGRASAPPNVAPRGSQGAPGGRPEFPPGANKRTSPADFKRLMDEFVNKQGNPAEVERMRKLIREIMDRSGK